MSDVFWWYLLAGLPLIPLAIGLYNRIAWPRDGARLGTATPDERPTLSVCIPARDEASNIEACVRCVVAARTRVDEILVLDDNSSDATPGLLQRLSEEVSSLRVLTHSGPLPEGWVGKVHACHLLSAEARGDLLLFLDADTRVEAMGIERLLAMKAQLGAKLVSAVPRQIGVSWVERVMMPLLHLTYMAWLPLTLVWRSDDPRFSAANGQLLLVERAALAQVGGFRSIRNHIVDDMALLRRFKQEQLRVAFVDGYRVARTRMYHSAAALWQGFSKNLYEGIGGTSLAALGVAALYFGCFVLPYIAAVVALWFPSLLAPALSGVLCNVLLRSMLALRFGHGLLAVVLHPFAVLALLRLLSHSRRLYLEGRITWRGRAYLRGPALPDGAR